MHLISAQGSERATSGAGGKLVSRDGKTHVVWQDSVAPARFGDKGQSVPTSEGYLNQVRTFDHATGAFTDVVTLNWGVDNHARPNIVMDHDGYLHVVISGHNSPVTYRRSVRPNDSAQWTDPETIGEGTYPVPVCAADGTLYMVMRANRLQGAELYVKPPGRPWRLACKLVERTAGTTGYAAYHGGPAVAADGTVHVVVNFYEGQGTHDRRGLHQAVCYFRSADRGRTWTKADGTPIDVPAFASQADVIARDEAEQRPEPMPPPVLNAAGNITVDAAGCPHVLYLDHRLAPGRIVHATADAAGRWSRSDITATDAVFPDHRPAGVRGALTVCPDGSMLALVELQPFDDMWQDGLPTRAMNFAEGRDKRLAWLASADDGRTWSAQRALDSADFHQPNVERATGGNRLPVDRLPPFVFFDGASRYPAEGEIIQNDVYLIAPDADSDPPSPERDTGPGEKA